MRWAIERVSDPDIEPVSVATFVRNVGEFQAAATDREDDITAKLQAAREWAENHTGRALIDQAWKQSVGEDSYFDVVAGPADGICGAVARWCATEIILRRSPVLAITSFVSVDAAGEETELDPDSYELRDANTKRPRVVALGAPWTTGLYRITFRAGYANRDSSPQQDASVVPARFGQAILLYAQALYDVDDKAMQTLMDTAEKLIDPESCHFNFA